MSIELGVVLTLITVICGVAYKLGMLAQKVEQITQAQQRNEARADGASVSLTQLVSDVGRLSTAQEKSENKTEALGKSVGELLTEIRLLVQRFGDMRKEVQKSTVYMLEDKQ